MQHLSKLFGILTSRRFLAAVAASLTFGLAGDWASVAYTWLGYAGLVGSEDIAKALPSKGE